jgi:phage-related protein
MSHQETWGLSPSFPAWRRPRERNAATTARAIAASELAVAVGLLSPHYVRLDIIKKDMKPVRFLGDSLECLRDFPEDARHDAGYQLDKVQRGEQPDDFKPMPAVGKGVEEIRVTDESGAYRVIYVARRAEAVYVLHAFQKKTQATSLRDIEIARKRFGQLSRGGK